MDTMLYIECVRLIKNSNGVVLFIQFWSNTAHPIALETVELGKSIEARQPDEHCVDLTTYEILKQEWKCLDKGKQWSGI
jgi:hypothetical protein